MRKIHLDDRFISNLVRAFRSTTQWTVSSNVKFYLVHRSSSLVRSFQEARVAFTRARSFFNSCSIDRSARKPWIRNVISLEGSDREIYSCISV